ncbi:hypothetical protein FJU44_17140 [Acinetobacter baumannii]|nr:hypothetical protein IX88_07605 [Acinetobacter baumannii]KAB1097272.1 hypothetical protein F6W73_17590 [Acinetobacter baumannii]KQE45178.1 hypothetical protein APD45_14365 [Acinetobacter baumannii]MBC6819852.1 hypothetical protein [Acinetobacter baumannii]TQF20404.1 hypothetical protein FJU44_17140 [Acinetobacter baumannii]
MKINNDLSTSSFKPRTPIGLIICYLVLGLPASLGIGSLITQLLTFNISNFEGGSGYAWIWIFIIVSSVTYLACLIILPILLKKYVQALSTLVVIFGILGLFSLFFIISL